MPSAIVLSHRNVAHELGHLEPWLDRHGFQIRRLYREDRPALEATDLLIVLGSPTSVAYGYCDPSADDEIMVVGEWIEHDRPYLGICFGAQVLARALGGSVRRMPDKFRAYTPMSLTSHGPDSLGGSWALWHEDAISAPDSATVLATMPHADTVFVQGSAWGIQPHIEFNPEIVARLAHAVNLPTDLWDTMYRAMKSDESELAERSGLLLDSFWAGVNSLV
ncbi:MAG: gamma-glutamyl-gamma-aminobutyrate hydrolase family protein [Ilumatobacteraceae bacterium]